MQVSTRSIGICEECGGYFSIGEDEFRNVIFKQACPKCGALISPKSLGVERIHEGLEFRKIRWAVAGDFPIIAEWSDVEPHEEFLLAPWVVVPRAREHVQFGSFGEKKVINLDEFRPRADATEELRIAVCQKWAEAIVGEFGPEKIRRGYTLHRNSRAADEFGVEKRQRGSKEYPDGKMYMCVVDLRTFRELSLCGFIVVFEGGVPAPAPYQAYDKKDNIYRIAFA